MAAPPVTFACEALQINIQEEGTPAVWSKKSSSMAQCFRNRF